MSMSNAYEMKSPLLAEDRGERVQVSLEDLIEEPNNNTLQGSGEIEKRPSIANVRSSSCLYTYLL